MTVEYDRAKIMVNQSAMDANLKGKWNTVAQPAYGDFTPLVEKMTGISKNSASKITCQTGMRASSTAVFYFLNYCQDERGLHQLWNSVIYVAEITQKKLFALYPPATLQNAAQLQINKITGPEKFAYQDSLDSIMAVINSINKILPSATGLNVFGQRYDGTAYVMPYVKWGADVVNALNSKFYPTIYGSQIVTLRTNLINLQALVNSAQSKVQAQALLLEKQKLAAAGYLNQANALINKVTGTAKSTYINTVNSIVQQSYEAQITLFTALIPKIEATIIAQAKAAALAELNRIQGLLAPLANAIVAGLKMVINAARKTYWTDRYNKDKALAANDYKVQVYKSTLNGLNIEIKKETLSKLNQDTIKVIEVLPIALGQPLYDELKAILTAVNYGSQTSLDSAIQKIIAFAPRVDKVLLDFHAWEIEEKIKMEEAEMLAELAAIEATKIQEKEIKIIGLKQSANNLLPQLPADLQTVFINKMDDAKSFDLTKKLAFYTALVIELQEAIKIEAEFAELEAVDITGLVLEIEDKLDDATDFINTNELNEEAQWVTIMPVEGGEPIVTVGPTTTGGGIALPLALGAGVLLFNLV